jgi:hypothetical protein
MNTMGNYFPSIMVAASVGDWGQVAWLIVQSAVNMIWIAVNYVGFFEKLGFLGGILGRFAGPVMLAIQAAIVLGSIYLHVTSLKDAECI